MDQLEILLLIVGHAFPCSVKESDSKILLMRIYPHCGGGSFLLDFLGYFSFLRGLKGMCVW